MIPTITIDGNNIHDIPSFYNEINRVFMAGEDWKLGQSLDALDDLFYGGYGKMKGNEEICLVWKNSEKNKTDLGLKTTKAYYRKKLNLPSVFNTSFVQHKLSELENGTGETYYEIVLKIIGEHKNIKLVIC